MYIFLYLFLFYYLILYNKKIKLLICIYILKMKQLLIFYDNWCPYCTRLSRWIETYDILHKITPLPLRQEDNIIQYPAIDMNKALNKMASYNGKSFYYGYTSIYLISKRIPILWILFPLFWILHISKLGNYIYNEFAIRRKIIPLHCDSKKCNIN